MDADVYTEDLAERGHDGRIACHSPLEHDRTPDGPPANDAVEVIADDRVRQPGAEVGRRRAAALGGDHLAVHEHGALAAQVGRRGRRRRETRKLVHNRHAQVLGLLLEERPGASRADLVHHEVVGDHGYMVPAVPDMDVFRVLPADLKNRIDIGGDLHRGPQLAGDLVLDEISAQQLRGQVPAAARDRDTMYVQSLADRLADRVECPADGLDRPAPRGQIDAFIDLPFRAEEDEVCADRANVHAEVGIDGPFGRQRIERGCGTRFDREGQKSGERGAGSGERGAGSGAPAQRVGEQGRGVPSFLLIRQGKRRQDVGPRNGGERVALQRRQGGPNRSLAAGVGRDAE